MQLMVEGLPNREVIKRLRQAGHLGPSDTISRKCLWEWRQEPSVRRAIALGNDETLHAAWGIITKAIEDYSTLHDLVVSKLLADQGAIFVKSPAAAIAMLKAINVIFKLCLALIEREASKPMRLVAVGVADTQDRLEEAVRRRWPDT